MKKRRASAKKPPKCRRKCSPKKRCWTARSSARCDEIQKAVTGIVADMAKEKGFSIAIPTSQILYADPKLDITDEVLKRLNQKLPKLDVKFDAPQREASRK